MKRSEVLSKEAFVHTLTSKQQTPTTMTEQEIETLQKNKEKKETKRKFRW